MSNKKMLDTKIIIVNIDTNKNIGENHVLTLKLVDSNGNGVAGQIVNIGNLGIAITGVDGEAVFTYQSDTVGDTIFSLKYNGKSSSNDEYVYKPAQMVEGIFTTISNSKHIIEYKQKDLEKNDDVSNEIEYSEGSHTNNIPFGSYGSDEKYIFISYAPKDSEKVLMELKRFQNDGYNIHYDDMMCNIDAKWEKEIINSILGCTLFVVFLSQNAVESQKLRNELFLAIDNNIPILKIYLEEVKLKHNLKLSLASEKSILKHVMSEEDYIKKYTKELDEHGLRDKRDEIRGVGYTGGESVIFDRFRNKQKNVSKYSSRYNLTYLNQLIRTGNKEIKLEHNIILDKGEEYPEIIIENDLVIEGNGNSIDAQGKNLKFFLENNIHLKNITFKNISSDEELFFISKSTSCLIEKCLFQSNEVNGIITNNGQTIVKNSMFKNNKSSIIINNPTGKITIMNTNIENNEITGKYGAINNHANLKIIKCNISNNSSSENIILNTKSLQVYESSLILNQSKGIIFNEENNTKVDIIDCEFKRNNIEKSIIENNGYFSLTNTFFENNLHNDTKTIINKGNLTLVNLTINADEKTIENYGTINAKKISEDLKTKIVNKGTFDSILNTETIPIQDTNQEGRNNETIDTDESTSYDCSDISLHAYQGNEDYVFVSYAHLDAEPVLSELKYFQKYGINIWYDEGITPSTEWPNVIQEKLEKSLLLIIFITPNSVESQNVRNEINYANSINKPFIHIHLKNTELKYGMGLQLSSVQGILKYELDENSYIKKCFDSFRINGVPIGNTLPSIPPILPSNLINETEIKRELTDEKPIVDLDYKFNQIFMEIKYFNDLKEFELGVIDETEFNKRKNKHYELLKQFKKIQNNI